MAESQPKPAGSPPGCSGAPLWLPLRKGDQVISWAWAQSSISLPALRGVRVSENLSPLPRTLLERVQESRLSSYNTALT